MTNELKAALVKFANQDLAIARRKGSLIVAQTKLGNLDLSYENGSYTIHSQGLNARCLLVGKAGSARDFLVSSYNVAC